MGLNDYRAAFRESVIPVFVLILLDRYGELSSRQIRMYLERIGFHVSRSVLFRILGRLAEQNLCESLSLCQGRSSLYKANKNTAAYYGMFVEDLEDFTQVLVDLRDGKRHWNWGQEDLI